MIVDAHVVLFSRDAEADRAFLAEGPSPGRYLTCDDLDAEIRRLEGRRVACSAVETQRGGTLTARALPGRVEVGLCGSNRPSALGARS